MPTLTRGPLPPGVYWRRRVFVLALAGALVFVIGSWLRGGSDASSSDDPVAQQAGGTIASQTVTVGTRKGERAGRKHQRITQGPTYDPDVLVEPEGTCDASDILLTPRVEEAVAGRPVTIGLSLQTREAAACTWRLTPARVTLTISDGEEEIWTSRDCADALPTKTVVVRRVVATVVEMSWNARESDDGCPTVTEWVLPGDFTIAAAALGGEPGETTFDLASPQPETVTASPTKDRERDGEQRESTATEQGQSTPTENPLPTGG